MKTESPIRTGGWRARLRPSPAMLVAVVALFVALGGVGYAATTIGSEEIRNNSVQSVDVKNDDLLSRDIKDDTVLSRDITDGTVLSRDIADGTVLERDIDPEALAAFKGPRAFAHVTDDNTAPGGVHVDAATSKGVVEASLDPDSASATTAPSGACPGLDQASVTLTNALNEANVTIDGNFYVTFE
jgi:hypothetical protein